MATPKATWVPVIELRDPSIKTPQPVKIRDIDLIIVRHGDRYVATDRWCPHQGGDLAEGRLLGKAIKCPLHGFMFSLETGRGVNCSGFEVKVYEVKIENGVLSVRLVG